MHTIEELTGIMAACAAQEHELDELIAYIDACSCFVPATDELTDKQCEALSTILKYHEKMKGRISDSKAKVQEQFRYAKDEYMNLIEQARNKEEE